MSGRSPHFQRIGSRAENNTILYTVAHPPVCASEQLMMTNQQALLRGNGTVYSNYCVLV